MSKIGNRISRLGLGPTRAALAVLVASSSVAAGTVAASAQATAPAAVGCPAYSNHPAISWWATYHTGKAVTLCRAHDYYGNVLVDVQIVDFEAGGKMRIMSEPQSEASSETSFVTRTAAQWFDWVRTGNVGTPPPERLFSVANGSFSMDDGSGSQMRFPQKKWNALTSLGSDPYCWFWQGGSVKRYFGLSDPRPSGRQFAYIDTFDDPCPSDKEEINREFSTYGGKPVQLFDATIGWHPQAADFGWGERRTFLGTLSTDGYWHGTQDRAYLLTTRVDMLVPEARDILVKDFGTMFNIQLAGGGNTQYESMVGGIESSDPAGPRPVPEVLVIYDAP